MSRTRPSNPSKLNAIRNPDGIWINSAVFSEEATHFMKHGFYCGDQVGTPQWIDYWTEQHRRCKEGITIGGVKITGYHYNYLNFSPIWALDKNSIKAGGKAGAKIKKFPDFWDGDYNYFHAKAIARWGCTPEEFLQLQLAFKVDPKYLIGGKHMLVGKSRRKGYSFKNSSVAACAYNTVPNSLSLLAAYDKAFLYTKGKGIMAMATDYLNFYNEHTGWAKKRDYIDRVDAKRASFMKEINGTKTEAGYMSEIVAITCKDNPDAVRGKDAYEALLDETGAWPGFMDAYKVLQPSMEAGGYMTGQITGFGTGGDMKENGGTLDFAEMFYNPDLYNLMPFVNIWDEDSEGTECAFFHPMQWNMEKYTDDQGNSDQLAALKEEEDLRKEMQKKSSAGAAAIQGRVQEYPTKPAEAFLMVSFNSFPVVELRNRLNYVIKNGTDLKLGQPVTLIKDSDGIRAQVDLNNQLQPIWGRRASTTDTRGAVIIYEYPLPNAPSGLYKIGYDPYAQDKGTSYASIIVYKGKHMSSLTRDCIVAEYTGRPSNTDDSNQIFQYLCELYRCQGMHENMVIHVKNYFTRRNKLHLLARQPDLVISKNVQNSNISRVYGCHMDERMKDGGENYIKNWLNMERGVDEKGHIITTIDLINSRGMLEELISYNRKGNFDRVMALMMVMFQVEEEDLDKEYSDKEEAETNSFLELIPHLFVNG